MVPRLSISCERSNAASLWQTHQAMQDGTISGLDAETLARFGELREQKQWKKVLFDAMHLPCFTGQYVHSSVPKICRGMQLLTVFQFLKAARKLDTYSS